MILICFPEILNPISTSIKVINTLVITSKNGCGFEPDSILGIRIFVDDRLGHKVSKECIP